MAPQTSERRTPFFLPFLRRDQVLGLLKLGLEAVEGRGAQSSEAEWQAAMERFAPLGKLKPSAENYFHRHQGLGSLFPLGGQEEEPTHVHYWETIAERLSKSGWSWGCVAVVNNEGREIFVVDANRNDGRRYVVRSDEKLTAFLEIERICAVRRFIEKRN